MLTRRMVLAAIGMTALPAKLFASTADTILPLWPATPPGGGGPTGPISENAKGAISNIAIPSMEVFQPAKPNGAAVLVAGGGGYKRIEARKEALPAAAWLADKGFTAFVLSYRLPGEGWSDGPLAPLQDAQRALRLIGQNAKRFQIDPERIGVLGFSAGGHLLGLASTRSAFPSYNAVDMIDSLSARPAFSALIYPIITLEPPYDHTSSRRILIGKHPSAAESAEWSVQTHVRSQCPPMFLVQAKDDPISDPANTSIMADACRKAGIPVELHQLTSGGHGFGMGEKGTPTAAWPDYYSAWLATAAAQRG
jgi:acetyl esterase/lipase